MSDQTVSLERLSHHYGVFDEYEIFGFKYCYPDGQTAWHITSIPTEDPALHDLWLFQGKFRQMRMHLAIGGAHDGLIQDLGPANQMEPGEDLIIHKAIAEWESLSARSPIS